MKRFFPDFDTIHAFTLSLDYRRNELACSHCLKNDQFISHGIIYKQRSSTHAEKVGKRLFCSNRYGRRGCGRTVQLYIASEIPAHQYGSTHLFVFISALLAKVKIGDAYYQATGQSEPRNAWRWLKRLMDKLCHYRNFLKRRAYNALNTFRSSSGSLQHLCPTLARFFSPGNNGCTHYQTRQQQPFL